MSARSTSGKIVHNSLWYGLETLLELFVFLGTSIAVARYLGPLKLGYFSAVSFPVSVITSASGTGLAQATRKYMTDFIGVGRIGTARSVYDFTYKYQLLGAVSISAIAMVIVLAAMHPGYKLMAAILVLSMVPGLMSWVPAQANLAFEDASKNTVSAFGYIFSYLVVIVLTLHYRWDLPGIAAAMLIGRTAEVVLRTIPLNRFLRTVPREPLPEELGRSNPPFLPAGDRHPDPDIDRVGQIGAVLPDRVQRSQADRVLLGQRRAGGQAADFLEDLCCGYRDLADGGSRP